MLSVVVLVLLAGVIASVGGLLHIVVPPYETDTTSMFRRYGAAWLVGMVSGAGLPDPSQYGFPSTEVYLYIIGLIALGYTAIDVVKQFIERPRA
jgi:hypothetical protein